jgi:YidC/Oxa1 family membrane protein insertase
MDKRSLLAILIITIIILLLPTYYKLIYDEPEMIEVERYIEPEKEQQTIDPAQEADTQITPDETLIEQKQFKTESPKSTQAFVKEDSIQSFLEVETQLVSASITSKGGGKFIYWYLKEYDTWLNEPVKIIDSNLENGLDINFLTVNGEQVNLNNYNFYCDKRSADRIILEPQDQYSLRYSVEIHGITVEKKITFYGDKYHVDIQFYISGQDQLLLNNEYQIGWINGLPSNEKNISEDFTYSESYASMGEELEGFSIDSEEDIETKTFIGNTDWVAVRTKYFLSAIVPKDVETIGITFGGKGEQIGDVLHRKYNTYINVSHTASQSSDSYLVYLGPLDYSKLSDYENGLDDLILNHGWYERTFRAISLPIVSLLKFLYLFIPNYGIVIVIFSILVKIVVYPLTKKSYKSMKEMSRVQPLLAEMREKYKGDPQRLNKETMKLYKEHGINPLGGCLPMLLQLPLLGALFIVFRSTIQLRGASFIPGWIDDLSRPDTIFNLPFSLPLYGDQFNLLPILMAGSMIFQSKMTMQDPKQKAMVYLMPIFMLLIFNQFPSGLNLYYTLFNVLTIIQQKFTDNKSAEIKVKK